MTKEEEIKGECPVCKETVPMRSGRPKMHTIKKAPLPAGIDRYKAWCEGGNPLQDGTLVTPLILSGPRMTFSNKYVAHQIAALREEWAKSQKKCFDNGESWEGTLIGFILTLIDDRERFLKDNVRIVEEVLPKVLILEATVNDEWPKGHPASAGSEASDLLKSIMTGKED